MSVPFCRAYAIISDPERHKVRYAVSGATIWVGAHSMQLMPDDAFVYQGESLDEAHAAIPAGYVQSPDSETPPVVEVWIPADKAAS